MSYIAGNILFNLNNILNAQILYYVIIGVLVRHPITLLVIIPVITYVLKSLMSLYCHIITPEDVYRALKKQENHSVTPCVPKIAFLFLYTFHHVYITVQRYIHTFYTA